MSIEETVGKPLNGKKMITGVLVCIILITITAFGLTKYHNSPQQIAKRYVKDFNKGQYEKIIKYYGDFMEKGKYTEGMILKSLKDVGNHGDVPVMKVLNKDLDKDLIMNKQGSIDEDQIYILLDYGAGEGESEVVTMHQTSEGSGWQSSFPYPLKTVTVEAPLATTIFIDDEEKGLITSKTIEIANLLPGNHKLEMKFYNINKTPYVKEIYLSTDVLIKTPFETHTVELWTLKGAKVAFDDISMESKDGVVNIENVIPGSHDVTITVDDEMAEPFKTDVRVTRYENILNLYDIKPKESFVNSTTEKLHEYLKTTIEAYINYNTKDKNPLEKVKPLLTEKEYKKFSKIFYDDNSWNRTKEAKYTLEELDIYIVDNNTIYVHTVESWNLKSVIIDSGKVYTTNGKKELVYKYVANASYEFIKEDGQWKLNNSGYGSIEKQYLSSTGKWIKY